MIMKLPPKIGASREGRMRSPFDVPYNDFRVDLRILVSLNRILPRSLRDYLEPLLDKRVEQVFRIGDAEFQEPAKYFGIISEIKEAKEPIETLEDITNKKVAKWISEELDMSLFSGRFYMFVREMSLVYLVASFERFLGRIL